MTEIVINIPERLEVGEGQQQAPSNTELIPAERITGILGPDQIPVGVIPGLEDFDQIQSLITELSGRISILEENDYLTGPELDQILGGLNQQFDDAIGSIQDKASQSAVDTLSNAVATIGGNVAALEVAIDSKAESEHNHGVDQVTGLGAALAALQTAIANLGSAELDPDLAAIAALSTTTFGRALLTLQDLAAAKALLQIPLIVDSPDDIGAQPTDSDLTAIASLSTTAFGRGLLALVDQAAAQSYIGASSSGGTLPTISALTYTASQSTANVAASFSNLTDGISTTGGVTSDAGQEWVKADLGGECFIDTVAVAGGSITGFGGVSSILNQAVIQVSYNDSDWLTVSGLISSSDNSGTLLLFSVARRGRYVRVFRGSGRVGLSALLIRGYS